MTATNTHQAGNFTSGNSKAYQSESNWVHVISNKVKWSWSDAIQGKRHPVKEADILSTVDKLLQEIQDNMFAKAKAILQEKTTKVQSYEEFKKVLEEKGGFIKAAWCGSPDCEAKVKDETGATIRVRPFQDRGANL